MPTTLFKFLSALTRDALYQILVFEQAEGAGRHRFVIVQIHQKTGLAVFDDIRNATAFVATNGSPEA